MPGPRRRISEISEKELSEVADIVESFEIIGDFVAMYRKPGDLSSYIGLLPLASAARVAKTAKKTSGLAKIVTRLESASDVLGRVPGKQFSRSELATLKKDLASHGVDLIENASSVLPKNVGARHGMNPLTGVSVVQLRPGATRYEVWHELSHALDFKQKGTAYGNLTKAEKELLVYRRIRSTFWQGLNQAEQDHATRYIKAVLTRERVSHDVLDGLLP